MANSEFLEIVLPQVGSFRFTALSSYYIVHGSPLINYPRICELSWDRDISACLAKFGPHKTLKLEQAFRELDLHPHNCLPLLKSATKDLEHKIIPFTNDPIVID